MASLSKKTKARRRIRNRSAGRRRKNQESRASTLPDADLFANCGEPGQPAPKQS